MSQQNHLGETVLHVLIAVLAIACILGLVHVASIVPLHVPLDPDEGWNAYHAQAAMGAGPLYPQPPSLMTNNYPPLSFYLVGELGRVVGDNIVGGRILSLSALIVLSWALMLTARKLGSGWWNASLAVGFLVASLLLFSDYVGMNDPQFTGHALNILALLLLLDRADNRRLVIAAALCVTAFFIKHDLIVMPIVLTAWLLTGDRRSAIKFAGAGIVLAALGVAGFRLIYGLDLVEVLHSSRQYSLSLLFSGLCQWLVWAAPALAAVSFFLVPRLNDRSAKLCAIYLVAATLIGIGFLGGAGVDVNALFDADIALSLSAALALSAVSAWTRYAITATLLVPLCVAFVAGGFGWLSPGHWLHPMQATETVAREDIAFIRAKREPAMCEMLSLCYWAGKPAAVDVFNVGQQYATGRRSDDALVELIDGKAFGVIELDNDDVFPLTDGVRRAIDLNYRLDHTDEVGSFWVVR